MFVILFCINLIYLKLCKLNCHEIEKVKQCLFITLVDLLKNSFMINYPKFSPFISIEFKIGGRADLPLFTNRARNSVNKEIQH